MITLTEYTKQFNRYTPAIKDLPQLTFDPESIGKGFALTENDLLLIEFKLDENDNIIYVEADSMAKNLIMDDEDQKKITAVMKSATALVSAFNLDKPTKDSIQATYNAIWETFKATARSYIESDHYRAKEAFKLYGAMVTVEITYKLDFRLMIEPN